MKVRTKEAPLFTAARTAAVGVVVSCPQTGLLPNRLILCQNIAMRANVEDGEVGRFWQNRFRAVRLLDDAAILAWARNQRQDAAATTDIDAPTLTEDLSGPVGGPTLRR